MLGFQVVCTIRVRATTSWIPTPIISNPRWNCASSCLVLDRLQCHRLRREAALAQHKALEIGKQTRQALIENEALSRTVERLQRTLGIEQARGTITPQKDPTVIGIPIMTCPIVRRVNQRTYLSTR